MITDFAALGVPPAVAASLVQRGITEAFPIQSLALPAALEGRDVCGKAPTGSGKTLAFGIPVAERVQQAAPRRPRALILAPTRELAEQIHDEVRPLLKPRNKRVATFYGGVGFGAQLKALRNGVDVAVACPGRLLDLVNQGEFHLSDIDIVVLDEADRMADMGFLPEVRKILDQVQHNRQTLLFSATLDGDIDVLVRHYQKDPLRCEVEDDPDDGVATTHHFIDVSAEQRIREAAGVISDHGSTVVFCRTKHGTDRVARQLGKMGIDAVAIHGGRSQNQRQRALDNFTDGRVQALVATDVAARGIHVDDIGCVLHFDVAGDPKDYVHRSGRTGRAGASGVVVTFVTPRDTDKARKLRRGLGDYDLESTLPEATSNGSGTSTRNGNRARRPERGARPSSNDGSDGERGDRGRHGGQQRSKKNHRKGSSPSGGGGPKQRKSGPGKRKNSGGPKGKPSTGGDQDRSRNHKGSGAGQQSKRRSNKSPRPNN